MTPNEGETAVQEHPEEVDQQQPSPYGERNEDLPDQLVNALKCAIKKAHEQEKFLRRREILRDRKLRYYERGYQHIYENERLGIWMEATPGGTIPGSETPIPQYIDNYNIFQPYLRILEAQLTQNPPGIDFRPKNPNEPDDIEAAQTAEGFRHVFDRNNDVKGIQVQVVRMFGLSGRTIMWTRTEADAQKFGTNPDTGEPHRREVTTVYGTLESKVPILAKCQKEYGYCILFDDIDIQAAKQKYPKQAEKLKPSSSGIGENEYERIARIGVLQGIKSQQAIGESFPHMCTLQHCWFRPERYQQGDEFDNISDQQEGMTVGEELAQLFPSGCHVVFVGEEYVGSWDETMDDHLTVGFPLEGDGQFRLAFMEPMVIVQDRFNDSMNGIAENFDTGWPNTWIGCNDQDYDAILSQRSAPNSIRQLKNVPSGVEVKDRIYREGNPELPATFMQYVELLQGPLAQFILAAPPSLFGESMQDQKTASGYYQARAQAMGQLGIYWGSLQDMFASMYFQAALCASDNPDHAEEIIVPDTKGATKVIQLHKLSKGKFGAYPDEDSSFPETTAAKRGTLAQMEAMAANNPMMQQQIMGSPDNWEVMLSLMGFPEMTLTIVEARNKQIREIEILLQQSPLPPDPVAVIDAQVMGQPPPEPQSTVPVDELDYHQFEGEKCQEWLSSAACWKELHVGRPMPDPLTGQMMLQPNIGGVENVKLHAKEHLKIAAMAMMQAQQQPQQPGPNNKGTPKKPPTAQQQGAPPEAGSHQKPSPEPAVQGAATL